MIISEMFNQRLFAYCSSFFYYNSFCRPRIASRLSFSTLLTSLLFISLLLIAGCGESGGQNSRNDSSTQTANSSEASDSDSNTDETEGDTETALQYAPADISLNWQIPLSREDGSALPLDAIAGYEISYENSRQQITVITLNDPETNNHKINDLPPDDYQFAVFAFDTNNAISDPSPLASIRRSDFPQL
jgi:hypothetical protein